MGKPKLLWNVVSDPVEQASQVFVVIDNPDRRMINKIQQSILEEFAPSENFVSKDKNERDFNYRLMIFDTYELVSDERLRDCYHGRIKRDNRLYMRETGIDGLVAYVEGELRKD